MIYLCLAASFLDATRKYRFKRTIKTPLITNSTSHFSSCPEPETFSHDVIISSVLGVFAHRIDSKNVRRLSPIIGDAPACLRKHRGVRIISHPTFFRGLRATLCARLFYPATPGSSTPAKSIFLPSFSNRESAAILNRFSRACAHAAAPRGVGGSCLAPRERGVARKQQRTTVDVGRREAKIALGDN